MEVSGIPLSNCFGLIAAAVVVFVLVATAVFDAVVAVVIVVVLYWASLDSFASCRCSN